MQIDADSPREAALAALAVMRDPSSIATEFDVDGVKIDLGY